MGSEAVQAIRLMQMHIERIRREMNEQLDELAVQIYRLSPSKTVHRPPMIARAVKQKDIAKKAGITQAAVSKYFCGKARPRWQVAKRLGYATDTSPYLWLEGSIEEIRAALNLPTGASPDGQ